MNKIAVIYKSKYGATKQYAEWIAGDLGADLYENPDIKPSQLLDYDVIVYGGGLYARGISGIKLVTKNPCNRLVVFTVGAANPELTDYTEIINKNFSKELLEKTKIFHLRGGIDYGRLNFIDRKLMAMMVKMTSEKPESEVTEEDKVLISTYGKKVDFADKATISPIVEYVSQLKGE